MEEEININISVREEQMENKRVFVVNNEDLGVSDFGDTLDEAINNFRISMKEYLESYPEKKEMLKRERSPVLVSNINL